MKYILIAFIIIGCNKANPLATTTSPTNTPVSQEDPKLCRLPENVLDSLLKVNRVTEQDIRRCKPLSYYGL